LYPETKAGVAGAHASNKSQGNSSNASDKMSFASDTSKKTGKSKRTVERKASNGKKLKGMAAKIKAAGIDALIQLGDMLKATKLSEGGRPVVDKITGSKIEPVINDAPTLSDLGIDKKTSSLAQKLATNGHV
jgi:hypothetical protein